MPQHLFPELSCIEANTSNNIQNYVAFVIIDTANLLLALLGIWRLRSARGGIWNLLYRQVRRYRRILHLLHTQQLSSESRVAWGSSRLYLSSLFEAQESICDLGSFLATTV